MQKQRIKPLQTTRGNSKFRHLLKWQFSGWGLDQNVGPKFYKFCFGFGGDTCIFNCMYWMSVLYTELTGSNLPKRPKGKVNKNWTCFFQSPEAIRSLYPFSDCKAAKAAAFQKNLEQCIKHTVMSTNNPFFLPNVSANALPVTLFLIKYLCYWWIRVEFLCFATFASQADNILPWKYRPFFTAHFKERAWHYAMLWLLASLYHPFRVVCSATTFQGISFGAWHCETREIMFGNNMGWWQDMSNSWNYRLPFKSCPLPHHHCWWLDLLVPPPSLHKWNKSRGVSQEHNAHCVRCVKHPSVGAWRYR